MSTASVLELPLPLLLLIHLHLLEYPKVNDPEYDINLFNPRTRGLRDRIKSQQDITYFLVGKIGKGTEYAKKILPSYPCAKPADTTSFRTSLTKYIEQLRHQATHPPEPKKLDSPAAWWWKDVHVRKSTIEQCEGSNFERLLVSLSTHALFVRSGKKLPSGGDLSIIYASRLAAMKERRISWARTASSIEQRSQQLVKVRGSLPSAQSRYHTLTTDRLLAFVDSKSSDAKKHWSTQALAFMLQLSGLKFSTPFSLSDLTLELSEPLSTKPSNIAGELLPVAAAHHPSNRRKLKKSIFSAKSSASSLSGPVSSAPGIIRPYREHEQETIHDALKQALADLRSRPARIVKQRSRKEHSHPHPNLIDFRLKVDFNMTAMRLRILDQHTHCISAVEKEVSDETPVADPLMMVCENITQNDSRSQTCTPNSVWRRN